ncbi:MAG TPA: hypothetical protein PKC80_01390 [Burkholderiaceae bacterium]|nr:hypothetical protein [Burkholderiaceae bacterium]
MNMSTPSLAIQQQLLVLKNHFFGGLLLVGMLAMVGCSTTQSNNSGTNTASQTVKQPQNQVATPPVATQTPLPNQTLQIRRANFMQAKVTDETRRMADWVVDSGDNENRHFVIVDKKSAKVYVFHANGMLRGEAPVLLGFTVGDTSFPGIGDRPLSSIKPHEKTTPPGRFLSSLDKNIKGKDIVWIDYDGAVSLHAIVKGTKAERRAERLASPTSEDNRISFGCINAPHDFFSTIVTPSFKESDGIVYILPDVRPLNHVFTAWYDVDVKLKLANALPEFKANASISTSVNTASAYR